jgi:acetyltransferase
MRALFEPRSIAVVGASPRGLGAYVMQNFRTAGYTGDVFGVNPKYEDVLGYPCFPSLEELPSTPDVALLVVARERVVPALESAGHVGARAAIVFAIGFLEADAVGAEMQRRIVELAQEADVAVLGPNCQGLLNFVQGIPLYLDATAPYEAGRVALLAQSGSVATSMINNKRGVRWSHAVSSGNEAVVAAADALGYFVDCPDVDIVCAYVESIRQADVFFAHCDRAWELGKPVIVCAAGRTQAAQEAVAAHSGALAVPRRLVDAALERHNVIRVESLEEMLETAVAMQSPRKPRGRDVAVLTASGGQIELYHDNAPVPRLETPEFCAETQTELRGLLADFLPAKNPLDWWGSPGGEDTLPRIVDCVARDPGIDVVLQVGDFTSWPTGEVMRSESALDSARKVAAERSDVVFAVLESVGGAATGEHIESGLKEEILVLSGFETGLRALAHLVDYYLRRAAEPSTERLLDAPDLTMAAAQNVLAAAGLDVARSVLLDPDAPLDAASALGFPVVAKIGDEEVLHKTEVGGVIIDIAAPEELADAVGRLRDAGARTVLVQEQVRGGVEMFLGLQSAPDLGTFVIVGLGGIWTEVLEDVQIRPVGVTRAEAADMLAGLRGYPLLTGARGKPPVAVDALLDAIVCLDAVGRALADDLTSLDVNPLIVTEDRAVVVDAILVPREQAAVAAV